MVSCGYEPTAVMEGFGSLGGLLGMVRGTFSSYPDKQAQAMLEGSAHQEPAARVLEETSA
jgi:hypothetical protein